MKRAFEQVAEFHKAFNLDAPELPTMGSFGMHNLRINLIQEEFDEYMDAVEAHDMTKMADALADLAYVVIGTAVSHGLTRFGEIFDEVHRSNMSKLGSNGKPIHREDGKVLKGPHFTPPNIKQFIEGETP